MEQRRLGRTAMTVSALGYGCGAVGGLMVRGSAADQDRSVGLAIEHGVTYFDTAAGYGDGESERNIGRVLKTMNAEVTLGTKVYVSEEDRDDIGGAITASLEQSLA